MKNYSIVKIPDQILSQKTNFVSQIDSETKRLVKLMIMTMRQSNGIGLAANQIGQKLRLVVMEYRPDQKDKPRVPLTVMINPKIIYQSKQKDRMIEGCLSVPGLGIEVKRVNEIHIKAQDLKGQHFILKTKGLPARIIQHELDHLEGKLILDRGETFQPDPKKISILFFGSGTFGARVLNHLTKHRRKCEVLAVFTEPDKPAGRGRNPQSTPVKKRAVEAKIPFFELENLTDDQLLTFFKVFHKAAFVLADFGRKIPPPILNIAEHGMINIHPSLLPDLRGPSPITTALLQGSKITGVTLIKVTYKIDAGPIIAQKDLKIGPSDNLENLTKRLALLASKKLLETLPKYLAGKIKPQSQDENAATYTRKYTPTDALLNWKDSLKTNFNKIRAFPRSYCLINDRRLIIHQARKVGGKLVPKVLQWEGGRKQDSEDFINGYPKVLTSFPAYVRFETRK